MISGRWFTWKRFQALGYDVLGVLGTFTVFTALVEFFPSLIVVSNLLKSKNFLFILFTFSVIFSLYKNRLKNKFCFKLKNRDTDIELFVGNIEDLKAAIIVPVNSEFDMSLNGNVQKATSVKSMVIKKYFASDNVALQNKINIGLNTKYHLSQKEGEKYKLGTTLRIETDDKKKSFYFVVNSHKINEGRVTASEDGLIETLNGLWSYISEHGAKENISIPILGTGNGRLKIPREEVYKEILRSFIASCAGKNYCDKLTIVLRDDDVTKCKIVLEELVEFTKLNTDYADFSRTTTSTFPTTSIS